MSDKEKSPYLSDPERLADVIAAIQAMSTYKFYKLDFSGWADRIVGDITKASHWQGIFEEHPEFFRLDSGRAKASLVWRRQHQKRFDVDSEIKITMEKYDSLTSQQKARISRTPLSSDEISTLIKTATELHSHALEHKRESRWWVPILIACVGVASGLVGAIVGASIKASS